jgi:hypothetical protein
MDVTKANMLELFNRNLEKAKAFLASPEAKRGTYVACTKDRGMGLTLVGSEFRLFAPEGDCAKWHKFAGPASAWRAVKRWNDQLNDKARPYCELMALPVERVVSHHMLMMDELVQQLEEKE